MHRPWAICLDKAEQNVSIEFISYKFRNDKNVNKILFDCACELMKENFAK